MAYRRRFIQAGDADCTNKELQHAAMWPQDAHSRHIQLLFGTAHFFVCVYVYVYCMVNAQLN